MQFGDRQAVLIAMEMERRGEDFYRKAARVSKDAETVALLTLLADEESGHMADFSRLSQSLCGEEGCFYDEETDAYLTAIAADIVFPGGLMELLPGGGLESPEAVLHYAIRSERDSVLFYQEIAAVAREESARAVFSEILRVERGHLRRLVHLMEEQKASK